MQRPALVIKTGALGDLLVATAALWDICQTSDFSHIDIMGSPLWIQILDPVTWPRIKSVFVHEKSAVQEFTNSGTAWVAGARQKSSWIYKKYSTTINLRYESLRYAWGPWLAHVPTRIGTCAWPAGFLYTHRAPWKGQAPLMHERERNFQVISAYPKFTGLEKAWAEKSLPVLKTLKPSPEKGRFVLVNPTASQRFKAWPAARFADLVKGLQENSFEVRLVGTKAESDWLREVHPDSKLWIQPHSISELMDVVGQAKMLIANASSMHFIAASFQVPSFVLMGAARPEVWAPLGSQSHYLRGRLNADEEARAVSPEKEVLAFSRLSVDEVSKKCLEILSSLSGDSV